MATVLVIQMPSPENRDTTGKSHKMSVEEKVRHMIECIESYTDSTSEWLALNKFYTDLQKRKGPRAERLRNMIEPVMAKYGQHGVGIRSK